MPVYKVVIIGAGPAGYFTAQALQKAQINGMKFQIDILERLPTPWGLVRSGVAPDHQKTKGVSKVFEKIAREPNFRLFANLEAGKDVSIRELCERYDAVVMATGASIGNRLRIPGEHLVNSLTAAEFVPWYNGHPDFTNVPIDLNHHTAVIIGAGNVAIDVARTLVLDPRILDQTDIAQHALLQLQNSKIRHVIVCGRRGPEHASFTMPELRSLSNLEGVDVCFNLSEIESAQKRAKAHSMTSKETLSNLEAMRLLAITEKKRSDRKLEIRFLTKPIEIKGKSKVEELSFGINQVDINGEILLSQEKLAIKCGLVISAVGYGVGGIKSVPVENGRIKNIRGKVRNNLYVVGWAKRGPVGVIGTNKSDASDVVDLILAELKQPKSISGIDDLLKSRSEIIDQGGWEKINAMEILSGKPLGKPRLKEVKWDRLISLGRSI